METPLEGNAFDMPPRFAFNLPSYMKANAFGRSRRKPVREEEK
jgi:hypothetical protein